MNQLEHRAKLDRWIAVWVGPMVAILAILLGLKAAHGENHWVFASLKPRTELDAPASHVFRYDPATGAFQTFTMTVPGSTPDGVLAQSGIGHVDVYVADPGIDQIHRLVYTDTNHYGWQDYPLAPGSRPLNLVAANGLIWFTENGRDQIGRLDPRTGVIQEFDAKGSLPVGGPVDITTDGTPNPTNLWYSLYQGNAFGQFNIASGTVIGTYTTMVSGLPTPQNPYGIAAYTIGNTSFIWTTELTAGRGTRLQFPWNGYFSPRICLDPDVNCIPANSTPYRVVIIDGSPWFLLRSSNALCYINLGTNEFCRYFYIPTPGSTPADMAVQPDQDGIWFTAELSNQLGHFTISSGVFDMVTLPVPKQAPRGISVTSDGIVWLAAGPGHPGLFLPVIFDY